ARCPRARPRRRARAAPPRRAGPPRLGRGGSGAAAAPELAPARSRGRSRSTPGTSDASAPVRTPPPAPPARPTRRGRAPPRYEHRPRGTPGAGSVRRGPSVEVTRGHRQRTGGQRPTDDEQHQVDGVEAAAEQQRDRTEPLREPGRNAGELEDLDG